jgi:peptidoglycan hydrolase-like protein with peptidoglycan-binding domain
MKSLHKLLIATAAAALASGCSITPRDYAREFEKTPILNIPTTAPTRSMSSFSDSLSCMDKMLRDYKVSPVLISSKNIPDVTGKISVATKEMMITSLSMMSRTSNTFRFVDFEIDALKQDTIQNLTSLLLNAGQMKIQRPALYVSGALSFMDQNISVDRMGGGISATNWDVGMTRDLMSTAFGLELHLGDFSTRTLLPGVDSSNTIIVANTAVGGDVGGRIKKTGIQFNFGREVSQGTGQAVRTLVDLGLIELVGKWARVPYWQCVSLDQTHPEFQAQMRAWWDDMTGDERVRLFQNALRSSSYYSGAVDGRPNAALREAISRFQADQNVTITGNVGFETYERLAKDYVRFDGAGNFVRVGWGPADKRVAIAKGGAAQLPMTQKIIDSFKPQNDRPAMDAPKGREPQVTLLLSNRDGAYTVGDAMSYSVSLDRQAYVYCYYQDWRKQVSQVYPNPLQRTQPMRGNSAVQVPDAGNPNSFTIEFDKPGREEVACFAAEQEIITKLPPMLRGPALQPLSGVTSVDDMQKAFAAVLGDNKFGVARAKWTIGKK